MMKKSIRRILSLALCLGLLLGLNIFPSASAVGGNEWTEITRGSITFKQARLETVSLPFYVFYGDSAPWEAGQNGIHVVGTGSKKGEIPMATVYNPSYLRDSEDFKIEYRDATVLVVKDNSEIICDFDGPMMFHCYFYGPEIDGFMFFGGIASLASGEENPPQDNSSRLDKYRLYIAYFGPQGFSPAYWFATESLIRSIAKPATSAPVSGWAAAEVTEAREEGILPFNLQSNYTQAITREEFCELAMMLYLKVTDDPSAYYNNPINFSDTFDDNVRAAAQLGIVNGVGGDRFDPDSPLTREQAAAMLSRLANAMGHPLPAGTPNFTDNANISGWAKDAVGQMQAAGIMGGMGNGSFGPGGQFTREQAICTAMRLYDLVK